jgi:hypothetical protein
MSESLQDYADRADELALLREANRRLQRQLQQAKAKTADLADAVYTAARDAALTIGPAPAVPPPPKDKRKAGAEVALVHATDWQRGKRTDTYSMEVCDQRINLFADKIAKITEIQRADHPVNECHIMFGGDMVEGITVFPGQAFEVQAHLFDQLFGVVQLQEQFVRRMLAIFPRVVVWEEYGNHGRIGRRGDVPGSDNIDRIGYRITRDRFAGNDRVTWHSSTNWHQIVTIGNYRAMLAHGDEIKSFGGNTPAFGILRKATAWSSGVVDPFADVYLGHFHTPMALTMPNGGRIFVTGSPESDNQYAAEFVAAKGKPSQRLHYIDPAKGRVTGEYVVWLD